MRLAVVGKGGAGKSVIAGTMARVLARRGHQVLALDSDLLPGLSISLGSGPDPVEPPLNAAAERGEDNRWRLRRGIGPVRAVQRYSTEAPEGIRLLQLGKTPREGIQPIMGSVNAFYKVVHRLARENAFPDWTLLGDLPAGPRQAAFDWAPYAQTFVVVVQPGSQSMLTARRVARIARMRRDAKALFVVNRVRSDDDVELVENMLGEPAFAAVPADGDVAEAERMGVAPIDHAPDAPAIRAIHELVVKLEGFAG
jgi:CO dehydrogenase maturation factor